MGNKDFTDWNGQKRKELVRPKPVREKWLRGGGKKEKVGFKTMVDRYKAELTRVREWLGRRKRHRGRFGGSGLNRWWWNHAVLDQIKDLRRIKEAYQQEGILERVLEALK